MLSAVIGPRLYCNASFTASARVKVTGPAAGVTAGTLPETAPPTCTELLIVLTPPAGEAFCWMLTEPAWFGAPESGSPTGRLDVCATGPANCGQAHGAARQARKGTAADAKYRRPGIYIHTCTILHTFMYIIEIASAR